MSDDKVQEIDVMHGLKTVLNQIEAAVARRSKVSDDYFTHNFECSNKNYLSIFIIQLYRFIALSLRVII